MTYYEGEPTCECKSDYHKDEDGICRKIMKEPNLFSNFFNKVVSLLPSESQSKSGNGSDVMPLPTSNPAQTAGKNNKEQQKQEPKVLKECYDANSNDRIIQYDNGTTICQSFTKGGKSRVCFKKCG